MNISNEGREGDKKMEKLEKCDYGNAAGLFEGTNHGIPLIYSVLEGKGAGNIYVDSVSEPQNALILPQGGFFYLASKDHSRNFLLQVKELIFQELDVYKRQFHIRQLPGKCAAFNIQIFGHRIPVERNLKGGTFLFM